MKLHKVTVAIAVVFGCGVIGSQAVAEKDHEASRAAGAGSVGRVKTVAGKTGGWKEAYQEIIDALGAKKGDKAIVEACGTKNFSEADQAAELKKHFQTIFAYRDSLNGCKDEVHGKLKGFFDAYIDKMNLEKKKSASGSLKESIEESFKSLQGMDSALRFHEQIKKFLEEKAETLKSSKDKFAEADEKVVEALDGIFGLCVAKEFKPSDDAKTTQQIDEFNNQIKKLGIKEENACELELEAPGAPVPDTSVDSDSISTEEEAVVAPPAGDGQQASQQGAQEAPNPAAGLGALPPGAQSNVLPVSPGVNVPFQGNSAFFDPAQLNNQLEQDQVERQQILNELIRARQDAVQPNRVGGSPDNSRSFQFPPVSVQPQPQQQNPQQQQYPQQQQQPFPPYPMMPQPVAATAIPPELLGALRNQDPARPSPLAAAQAAQTQSMMEMAKLQQQLMQAQMANQMMGNNPYMQNGPTSNINRLRRTRTAFRGARGTASSRFMNQGSRTGRVR
ncbi:MAG: hypothetical protein EBQ92_14020 [Proteobacteria bacterium]|nr:hypothetical protein [Pseudomonadota bacterium]